MMMIAMDYVIHKGSQSVSAVAMRNHQMSGHTFMKPTKKNNIDGTWNPDKSILRINTYYFS